MFVYLLSIYYKTVFVKFKISNNFKKNIDEKHAKQTKIHTRLWIFKISRRKFANQKSRDFCQKFVISKLENRTLGYGFKNL